MQRDPMYPLLHPHPPPKAAFCITTVQYHTQCVDIDIVKIEDIFVTIRVPEFALL